VDECKPLSTGSMTAWAASGDGAEALAAAEAAVLAPLCSGSGGGGGGGGGGAVAGRVCRIPSGDPRDACSARAALLAELVAEQTVELEMAAAAAEESRRFTAEAAAAHEDLTTEAAASRHDLAAARGTALEMAAFVEAAREAMVGQCRLTISNPSYNRLGTG